MLTKWLTSCLLHRQSAVVPLSLLFTHILLFITSNHLIQNLQKAKQKNYTLYEVLLCGNSSVTIGKHRIINQTYQCYIMSWKTCRFTSLVETVANYLSCTKTKENWSTNRVHLGLCLVKKKTDGLHLASLSWCLSNLHQNHNITLNLDSVGECVVQTSQRMFIDSGIVLLFLPFRRMLWL